MSRVSIPADPEDFFGPDNIVVELQATDRWRAIDELIDQLVLRHRIEAVQRDAIVAGVKKREYAMTTGVGFGIALPHASTELVHDLVNAIGFSRSGVQFDALDGKPVDLVCLFLVPPDQFQKHLNTLANLAKLLHDEDFRAKLRRRFG